MVSERRYHSGALTGLCSHVTPRTNSNSNPSGFERRVAYNGFHLRWCGRRRNRSHWLLLHLQVGLRVRHSMIHADAVLIIGARSDSKRWGAWHSIRSPVSLSTSERRRTGRGSVMALS